MRVMLIQPPSGNRYMDKYYLFEPLGLEYLGAALKEDRHDVVLLDARLEPDFESAFRSFGPEVVGITGFTNHLKIVKSMAAELKKIDQTVFIMVGGHHATVRPQDYNLPYIDLVVIGEGVAPLREIMKCLEGRGSWVDIPGLGIPGPTKLELTAPRPHPSLGTLPFPDRSLTAGYRANYFCEWLRPMASIRTSLGCVNRCNFCALWAITDGRYLRRQPESVVEELKNIEEEVVFFCDDESMADWRRMDVLADLIKESGLEKKYFTYARVDTIAKHPDMFAKWKDIGLIQVFVGFESYSNERLNDLKKNITMEEQEQAAQILKDLKIDFLGAFMVDPSFTKGDFRAFASYVRKIEPTRPQLTILTPLPGTELYNDKIDDLITDDPEMFDFVHTVLPTTLPIKEFYSEYYWLFQKTTSWKQFLKVILKFPPGRRFSMLRDYLGIAEEIKRGYIRHERV